jgi:hypothetical protein
VRLALSSAWIFSIWGSIDLLNAFYQANHAGLLPGQLGAAYVIPTLVLPLLLITHGLAFRILLQHQKMCPRYRKAGYGMRPSAIPNSATLAAPAVRNAAAMKGGKLNAR